MASHFGTKKVFTLQKSSTLTGLAGDTNMATVSVLYTNTEITTTWYYVNSRRNVDSEKIRVPDGIWTHDPSWSSRMLYHWATVLGNLCLAYGWHTGNLNWPIRIHQVAKIHCPHINVSWQERHWNQTTFLIGDCIKYSLKEIYNSQNHFTLQKVKNMKHLVSPSF